jgi:hypothetical protein
MISISMFQVRHPSSHESSKNYNYRILVIVGLDHHRLARKPLHKLVIYLAPHVLHYSWHTGHENYIHASHTHKGHTDLTWSYKTKLGAMTSKFRTPETPSSKSFSRNLIQQKHKRGWISCVKFSLNELSYKIRLNLSSYAKVMAALPNNMFLQVPQLGSRSNVPPTHHMHLVSHPQFWFDQSHWSPPALTGFTCMI